jgi:hypothetical protein
LPRPSRDSHQAVQRTHKQMQSFFLRHFLDARGQCPIPGAKPTTVAPTCKDGPECISV